METKDKEIIKDLYKDLVELVKVNQPGYYIMPLDFYNRIMETVFQLDADLKRVKKSRDKLKKQIESLKMNKAQQSITKQNSKDFKGKSTARSNDITQLKGDKS